MELRSVNIGPVRTIDIDGRPRQTAFQKSPVRGAIRLDHYGIAGDGHFDRGGPDGTDQAALMAALSSYAIWQHLIDRPLDRPGAFGETLTIDGLDERRLSIGDVLAIGREVQVQVTAPRTGCALLSHFLFGGEADPMSVPTHSLPLRRAGWFLRVLVPGAVQAGDAIRPISRDPRGVPLVVFHDLVAHGTGDRAGLLRALATPGLARIWTLRIGRWLAEDGARPKDPDPEPDTSSNRDI